MRSLVGSLVNAASSGSSNAPSGEPPVVYARSGIAPNTMMQGGADPGAYMRAYGANGTVYSIVSMLARQTAKVPWHLYRQQPVDGRRRYTTGDKGSDQRVEIIQHQAIALWNKPNAFMSGFMFRELEQTYLDLTGESYIVIARGAANFPLSLWPVRPDRIEPVPHATKFLAGYVYRGPSGELVPLQLDEVIMTKYPNPYDIYHGLGPIQSILVDIDSAKYSAAWNRNFFLNSATPGGIIQVDKRLSDDEWNEFTNRWRESHRGIGAAHRVAILEQGAEWVPNAHSIKDMDFASLRDVSRDVIREAFAMHKAILGTTDDVNRANAQTAQEHFESFLITDRLDRWRDTLNCFYLPLFGATGQGVEMDHDDAVTANREADALELRSKTQSFADLVGEGVDPHDAAEVVGLPDMNMVEKATQAPALPPGWVPELPAAPAPPAGGAQPQPGAEAAFRRAILGAATQAQVDLSEMDAQHARASAALNADYQRQITPVWQQQLTEQVRQLVAAGAIAGLATMALSTMTAKALILAAMTEFGATSARQASKEARQQGADAPPQQPQQGQLDAIATATATLLATELATAAGREATRAAGGTQTPDADQIAQHVAQFLAGLSTAGVAAHLAGALAAAQNQARHATFTAGPRCELRASEVNDRNTCEPCAAIDGHSFGYSDDPAAVDAAAAAYPTSGYIACEGLERCRGALAAIYETDNAKPAAEGPADYLPWFLKDLNDAVLTGNGHSHAPAGAR
ncbi:MAG TPA: phage portal protein [Lacunisphaera sp.]